MASIIGFITQNILYIAAALLLIALIIVLFFLIKAYKKTPVKSDKQQPSEVLPPEANCCGNFSTENSEAAIPSVGVTHSDNITREEKMTDTREENYEDKQSGCVEADAEGACLEVLEGKKRVGSIEIYTDAKNGYRFRIKAANNEIVAHSESYTSKSGCVKGINAVTDCCSAEVCDLTQNDCAPKVGKAMFQVYQSSDGKFRFRLRAKNMRIILSGQGYKSKAGCMNGIDAVKKICLDYSLKDISGE